MSDTDGVYFTPSVFRQYHTTIVCEIAWFNL